eukprot:jgi/Tetstr1/438766/TSEL_027275.t1
MVLATASRVFVSLSLLLNVVVLVLVCYGMLSKNRRMDVVFGEYSPARGILTAIYLSILVVSAILLILVQVPESMIEGLWMSAGLFVVQIVYKLVTVVTVKGAPEGMKFHPVVLSNVGIAIFHLITVIIVAAEWNRLF